MDAALESEPDNEELIKLKCDLEEVIKLQEELAKDTAVVGEQPLVEFSEATSSSRPKKEISWKASCCSYRYFQTLCVFILA